MDQLFELELDLYEKEARLRELEKDLQAPWTGIGNTMADAYAMMNAWPHTERRIKTEIAAIQKDIQAIKVTPPLIEDDPVLDLLLFAVIAGGNRD